MPLAKIFGYFSCLHSLVQHPLRRLQPSRRSIRHHAHKACLSLQGEGSTGFGVLLRRLKYGRRMTEALIAYFSAR